MVKYFLLQYFILFVMNLLYVHKCICMLFIYVTGLTLDSFDVIQLHGFYAYTVTHVCVCNDVLEICDIVKPKIFECKIFKVFLHDASWRF